MQFPVVDLDALFRDHAVFGGFGEIFLTDVEGRFLTTLRYPPAAVPRSTSVLEQVSTCLG